MLKAGRETDLLILEKVLGFKWEKAYGCWRKVDKQDVIYSYEDTSPFSTNTSHAMYAIEYFRKYFPGCHIQIGTVEISDPYGNITGWYCEIFGEGLIATLCSRDTLAMAICQALLTAVGAYRS